MQNKILWKKFEEDFWNWKTHQVVVMGPLSSMSSDYSQSFFPDRWKTAWGRVSGSCLAGSLQSSTLQVGWIPLDWESPKRKGQCLTLSSHQSQCQPLFSRHEVTEVRPRAPLGCLLSSVRGCTQGAWAGWVDWLHCRAFYQRTECGGACQGAGSGRCLINKKYSCFYIEQVWQPALLLPEPRHEHFVRATMTQLGRMLFRVTYWHHPSVHSDGPAPSFAFSQGLLCPTPHLILGQTRTSFGFENYWKTLKPIHFSPSYLRLFHAVLSWNLMFTMLAICVPGFARKLLLAWCSRQRLNLCCDTLHPDALSQKRLSSHF